MIPHMDHNISISNYPKNSKPQQTEWAAWEKNYHPSEANIEKKKDSPAVSIKWENPFKEPPSSILKKYSSLKCIKDKDKNQKKNNKLYLKHNHKFIEKYSQPQIATPLLPSTYKQLPILPNSTSKKKCPISK